MRPLHLVLPLLLLGSTCVWPVSSLNSAAAAAAALLSWAGMEGWAPPPIREVGHSSDTPSSWLGKPAWKASASLLTPGWQGSQVSPGGILGHTPFLVHVLASALCCALPVATVARSVVCWLKGARLSRLVPSSDSSGSLRGTDNAG